MIGKLRGIVDRIDKDCLIVDVGGVGYEVFCSSRTISQFAELGQPITLVIETHVREDHIHLYGFVGDGERECYRQITKVQGVGSKIAMAILGAITPEQLSLAIAAQDRPALTQISGIGPKLADRMLTELNGASWMTTLSLQPQNSKEMTKRPTKTEDTVLADTVSALVNLGYNRSDSFRIAGSLLSHNPGITFGELLKSCLKEITL